ncbi:MAG: acetolactate synthase small subunit [Acidobacteriota bacterium]
MGQVISLLVENKAGVLSRVVGLFSQRGYNIQSLNVAPALDSEVSRITLTTRTDQKGVEQVVKQLSKLIDVVQVTPFDSDTQIIREMALVRIKVSENNRAEVLALSEVFRARVIDVSPENYVFELTGSSSKIDAFLENVTAYGIREIHRTGELTLGRGKAGNEKGASGNQGPKLVKTTTD